MKYFCRKPEGELSAGRRKQGDNFKADSEETVCDKCAMR
jgi:hypothetical protein